MWPHPVGSRTPEKAPKNQVWGLCSATHAWLAAHWTIQSMPTIDWGRGPGCVSRSLFHPGNSGRQPRWRQLVIGCLDGQLANALRPLCYLDRQMQTATRQKATIDTPTSADLLTVGSIGILAYMLGNVLHEALGHGGACVLAGGKPLVLSSVDFECSLNTRLVTAGGTLINLGAGVAFFALGRFTNRSYPRLKYFCWISMAVNLFAATGYFLFSGIGGIGDWAVFIQGLRPQWAWRIALAIFGAGTYLLAARISLLELRPLIGNHKEHRYRRAVRLASIPYFAGGILMCIAGSFNPQGMNLILISAAASTFGGTSGLMWFTQWLKHGTLISYGPPAESMMIPRSWPLIVASCAIALAFIAVLGPSVRFSR